MPTGQVLIADRYRLLKKLGSGGMGEVHLAEDVVSGECFALKLLHEERTRDRDALARFVREARIGERIDSPHVVKVVDAGATGDGERVPFLVMELLEGKDLEALVLEGGRMPAARVVRLMGQAAEGLGVAHASGVVHRDLKPHNLFVHQPAGGPEILKILDFGLAKRLTVDPEGVPSGVATRSGKLLGTPRYMAPEQVRGHVSQIGPWTDLWALGLITLRLLTAEHYWGPSDDLVALMFEIHSGDMRRPTERWPFLPQGIDAWFLRACARDREARFATAKEQQDALVAAAASPLHETPTLALPELPRVGPGLAPGLAPGVASDLASATGVPLSRSVDGAPRKRRPWAAVGLGAAAGVAAIGGLAAVTGPSRMPEPRHGDRVTVAPSPTAAEVPPDGATRAVDAGPPRPASSFVPAMP